MLNFFIKRKVLIILVVIILLAGAYFIYVRSKNATAATRYVFGAAVQGSIIITVSGSGQISASNQVELKPKASGEVTKILVQEGQAVKADDVLMQLDTADMQKSLRDAQANLQSAKLSLEKLKQPATAYAILQAENSLTGAKDNLEKLKLSQSNSYQTAESAKTKAAADLDKAYDDAFNAVANTFLNLPTIVAKLNDILYSSEIGNSEAAVGDNQWNVSALINTTNGDEQLSLLPLQASAENDYKSAQHLYGSNFAAYRSASRYSERAVIEALLAETLETARTVSQAAKSSSNYLDTWVSYRSKYGQPIFAKVTAYQSNLNTYTGQLNSSVSSLSSADSAIQTNKDTINEAVQALQTMTQNQPLDLAAAEATIKERQMSLEQLKQGADELDLQSQQLAVAQRQNAVSDIVQQLADYTVRAPFDGTIAKLSVTTGDQATSGTAVTTIIAPQMVAEISLNEVDAAKVAVGQQATLQFDAVSDLEISGRVGSVDMLGAVAQGVVTYTVKIALDTQDERIKPGMTVSVNIITAAKQDILIVPNSAVKSSADGNYVEMSDEVLSESAGAGGNEGVELRAAPRRHSVTIGLANDNYTEIITGLAAGEQIIVRTITLNTNATTPSPGASLLQVGGGRNTGFGGGTRGQTIGR